MKKDEFGLKRSVWVMPFVLVVVVWSKLTISCKRVWRWFNYQCVVCGRDCKGVVPACHYRYCSLECAAYDGALNTPSKSRVLFGTIKQPKQHYENIE